MVGARSRTSDGRPCPCGAGLPYADCCGPLHRGDTEAATPEQLVRSRYSAFAVGNADYLLRTWHATTRPAALKLDPRMRWVRLDVLQSTGGLLATEGTVHFRAHYVGPDGEAVLTENSRFRRENRRWMYLGPLTSA
jgi:SEC-C motif-containing protein